MKKQTKPENVTCKLRLKLEYVIPGWSQYLLVLLESVPPIKRGKGRPKKKTTESENVESVPPVKRGKGRPKKEITESESPSYKSQLFIRVSCLN